MFNDETLRVHLVHYSPFAERREHMEGELAIAGLKPSEVHWMLEHDQEAISEAHRRGELGDPDRISAGSVSLIMKHLAIYRRICEESDRVHLILEDDVRLSCDFPAQLSSLMEELPEEWDLFFVGEGCDLHVPWWRRRRGKRVYWRGWRRQFLWGGGGCSRCTEAYLIHPMFARRVLESKYGIPPFTVPIDWHLNRVGQELKARAYWAEPPLASQGVFESWTKDSKVGLRKGQV